MHVPPISTHEHVSTLLHLLKHVDPAMHVMVQSLTLSQFIVQVLLSHVTSHVFWSKQLNVQSQPGLHVQVPVAQSSVQHPEQAAQVSGHTGPPPIPLPVVAAPLLAGPPPLPLVGPVFAVRAPSPPAPLAAELAPVSVVLAPRRNESKSWVHATDTATA